MLFQKHFYSIITFVLVSTLSNQSSLRCGSRILPTTFAGEYANILPSLLMGVGPKNKHMAFPSGQYATSNLSTSVFAFSSSLAFISVRSV